MSSNWYEAVIEKFGTAENFIDQLCEKQGLTKEESVSMIQEKKKCLSVDELINQLTHPLLEKGMLLEGDCFFCEDHSDENLMCVSSLPKYGNNSLFIICKHCFDLHTFITF